MTIRIALAVAALAAGLLLPAEAGAALIASPDGLTVDDTADGITWLANADLAGSAPAAGDPANTNLFGVKACSATVTRACVNPDGAMDYKAAVLWVQGLNSYVDPHTGVVGYDGHTDWQLPTTPILDGGCTRNGPSGNSFAYDCTLGGLGSLYYNQLGLKAPDAAVPAALNTVGPFKNFQPNLYWSGSQQNGNGPGDNGYHTFSFASGYQGGNIPDDFLDVLPMAQGTPTGPGNLTPILNGNAVFDPTTGIIWAADANLAGTFAKDPTLLAAIGMSLCNGISPKKSAPDPICINADGTMDQDSAQVFVAALNSMSWNGQTGYLGLTNWALPLQPEAENCAFDCTDKIDDMMTNLFYNELGQQFLGGPLVGGSEIAPAAAVIDPNDPFTGVQPYEYWTCEATSTTNPITSACSDTQTVADPDGTFNFQFDFSFDNGLLGTIHNDDDAFVTAYYVNSVPEPATFAVFAAALAGLGALHRQGRRRKSLR